MIVIFLNEQSYEKLLDTNYPQPIALKVHEYTDNATEKKIQNTCHQRWGKQNLRHTLILLSASAQITCTFKYNLLYKYIYRINTYIENDIFKINKWHQIQIQKI